MSELIFMERPTLSNLYAFQREMDRLREEARSLRQQAQAFRDGASESSAKVDKCIDRYIQRNGGPVGHESRDTGVFRVAPGTKRKAADQQKEAERLETAADAVIRQRMALENLHQMEAYDYREYLSQCLPLPVEREALYLHHERIRIAA